MEEYEKHNMTREDIILPVFKYDKIFIVEDLNFWGQCKALVDKGADLVLTLDFALKLQLEVDGYAVEFLDHLLRTSYLQARNFEMHHYLSNWFKDNNGNDIFAYNSHQVGNAFLLNINNLVSYHTHFFFNMKAVEQLDYKEIVIAVKDDAILWLIKKLRWEVTVIADKAVQENIIPFYFPINKWIQEKIERTALKDQFKLAGARFFDYVFCLFDLFRAKNKKAIFIQNYFPTRAIINQLKREGEINVLLGNYTGFNRTIFKERRIFFSKRVSAAMQEHASVVLAKFRAAEKFAWTPENVPLSEYLLELILPVITPLLPIAYSEIATIEAFFKRNTIKLMIPITDFWMENRLMMNYCKKQGIPVFMIINGLLTHNFENDGRDADWVNSYSESIKEDYFGDAFNVLPLGDPRMDSYTAMEAKAINRELPNIVIGAAGYSPIDLNSYLAYEFDFLYDILNTCASLCERGKQMNISIKVRANGYAEQYRKYVDRYFPELKVQVIQTPPFAEVIRQADLYITFYSQTQFEAAVLGIPTIYYKKDTQVSNRPFNGSSELVTVNDSKELETALDMFYNNDSMFSNFMHRTVLEKYIGPLDGKNLERNIDFIKKFF